MSENNSRLLEQPHKCPNCRSLEVYYGRFVPNTEAGEYYCDDCGWGMDAVTGEPTNPGQE